MSTISKVFTILNVVLALFLLGTVASILARSDDYKGKYDDEVAAKEALRVDMQGQIDTVRSENGNLTSANTPSAVCFTSCWGSSMAATADDRNSIRMHATAAIRVFIVRPPGPCQI